MSLKEKLKVLDKEIEKIEAKKELEKVIIKNDIKIAHVWGMYAIKIGALVLTIVFIIALIIKTY